MKRIVITGMGVISSIGTSIAEFTESLREGRSGLKDIDPRRFRTDYPVYRNTKACTLDQDLFEDLLDADETVLTECSNRAIAQAVAESGLDFKNGIAASTGLSIGCSVGANYPFMRWVKDYIHQPELIPSIITAPTIAGGIARKFRIGGPITTINTACAAGTNSIGRACDFIRSGRAERMIAGGVDVFTDHTFSGFNSLMAISRSDIKPFDKNRDGMMLGDAAAYVILETYEAAKERGATIYGEVLGYSTLNEAYHATAPTPDGSMALRVMKEAVKYSGLVPEQIDYINAHGTATKANDEMEYKAVKAFADGRPTYASSSKSMFGHTLGAAGSVELVAATLGLYHGFVPPTINLTECMQAEEDANLNFVPNKAINHDYTHTISNSFGFAGNMASIVIKKFLN